MSLFKYPTKKKYTQPIQPPQDIEVRYVPGKGRGVFALRDFKKGEVIENCVCIFLDYSVAKLDFHNNELPPSQGPGLFHYVYPWEDEDEGIFAMVTGYGMIYNHATYPNAKYDQNMDTQLQIYSAIKKIKAGEEICVNYFGKPGSKEDAWFSVKD